MGDEQIDDESRNFLGAAFVGNDAIQEMDVKVNRDGMTEKKAAEQWIEDHADLWDSLFGILHDPVAEKEPEVEQVAQCSAEGMQCDPQPCCSGLQCKPTWPYGVDISYCW